MTLGEKAAYIQGLADGVELDETTKEGKLIAALIDLVGDMADAIEALEDDVDTLGDYVEVGCNAVLNPGTVIGRHSSVYPTTCARGVVPANSILKNSGEIAQKK